MYATLPIRVVFAGALALTVMAGCDTPSRPALQFAPATVPDAKAGAPYTADITVSQTSTPVGGASVQDGALPSGVDLALAKDPPNTVRISGTPKTAGTYTFTVSVWCFGTNVSGQTGTQQYTLTVK